MAGSRYLIKSPYISVSIKFDKLTQMLTNSWPKWKF